LQNHCEMKCAAQSNYVEAHRFIVAFHWIQESLVTQGLRARAMRLWTPPGKKSKLSRKPRPRTKNHVDQHTDDEVMGTFVYLRWPLTAILNFWKSKVAPLDWENPRLEPSIMSVCCIQPELCRFKYLKSKAAVCHLVQGHPRSSTLVPIESPYATSY